MNTKSPAFADVSKVAQGYVKVAPERLLWASDWPHPTEKANSKSLTQKPTREQGV
jgi:D-galactarolactone isomerase